MPALVEPRDPPSRLERRRKTLPDIERVDEAVQTREVTLSLAVREDVDLVVAQRNEPRISHWLLLRDSGLRVPERKSRLSSAAKRSVSATAAISLPAY